MTQPSCERATRSSTGNESGVFEPEDGPSQQKKSNQTILVLLGMFLLPMSLLLLHSVLRPIYFDARTDAARQSRDAWDAQHRSELPSSVRVYDKNGTPLP